MSEKDKKIGVMTSGGDAPGMNAAIRAVVRTALFNGINVVGIKRGYEGLLSGEIFDMTPRAVSETMHRGGTILYSARCHEMMTEEGQKRAAEICKVLRLDGLVVIGGDGSFRGAQALSLYGVNVMCIPGTIDMDIACTDYTIGFDTAVNTGMEAINKIRDTSNSHERCSVVEVMGRDAGHIALWCSLTGGAEDVLIPEWTDKDADAVIQQIMKNRAKGKTHNLVVVAEGIGGSEELAREIQRVTGIETRATILGYLQRGGSPTALDRMHASMMGYTAVQLLIEGLRNKVIIYKNGEYSHMDIQEALNVRREYDPKLYEIIKVLAV